MWSRKPQRCQGKLGCVSNIFERAASAASRDADGIRERHSVFGGYSHAVCPCGSRRRNNCIDHCAYIQVHSNVRSVFSHLCWSTTITFASQNSADSDMGRCPELKSDEFCDANVILIVIEIISHLCLKPLKQVVQLLAARPDAPITWGNLETL